MRVGIAAFVRYAHSRRHNRAQIPPRGERRRLIVKACATSLQRKLEHARQMLSVKNMITTFWVRKRFRILRCTMREWSRLTRSSWRSYLTFARVVYDYAYHRANAVNERKLADVENEERCNLHRNIVYAEIRLDDRLKLIRNLSAANEKHRMQKERGEAMLTLLRTTSWAMRCADCGCCREGRETSDAPDTSGQ
ncbi:hypothetical protein CYMTET_40326 [Cymbomonas tetramitiformis]|uniref:Uncharacterized protein n=1 Tax=Cymbomonas tetramitiformis TaxID=36881 RepID=A0AAE0C889_9CHLO|nr:hypothetical protein CYMTET_40326 [Cymbomonas tetramitiformis]